MAVFLFSLSSCEMIEKFKVKKLDEKLRDTIFVFRKGRMLQKLELKAGYPVKIKNLTISRIYTEFYDYKAVVTFEEKKEDIKPGDKMDREKLKKFYDQNLPFKKYFKHVEIEDRWVLAVKQPKPPKDPYKNKRLK